MKQVMIMNQKLVLSRAKVMELLHKLSQVLPGLEDPIELPKKGYVGTIAYPNIRLAISIEFIQKNKYQVHLHTY